MIDITGAVKVMDFGIARAMNDATSTMTQTSAVMGTAQYLSPEQARGIKVDPRSDIYSMGCVLFELLTGQPPFTGDSPVAVAHQHVHEEPPGRRRSVRSARRTRLGGAQAMSKNPANRYQSAADLRADLIKVLAGANRRRRWFSAKRNATSSTPVRAGTCAPMDAGGGRQRQAATNRSGRRPIVGARC